MINGSRSQRMSMLCYGTFARPRQLATFGSTPCASINPMIPKKSKQVRTMALIYQRADKVHVWLGPASNDGRIAPVYAMLETLALDQLLAPHGTIHSLSASLQAALDSFATRAWFIRRWILQEVEACACCDRLLWASSTSLELDPRRLDHVSGQVCRYLSR
jgi:hypothetical protein